MRRAVATLSCALAVALPLRAQQTVDSAGSVSARVLPETVTVGQPFMVNVRAVPVRGRVAVAPPVPDTGGIVEPLDPAVVTRRGDTLLVRYRLIAWEPGVLSIPLAPVVMRRDSSDIALPVDVRVVVASVLPADTAERIPKPTRALFPPAARWWESWWQWMLGLLALLSAVYLWHRWRTRERREDEPEALPPLARAEAAFARLDARQLPVAGEGGRHVTLATEVLRRYLADIEPSLPLTLTNAELLAAVRPIAGIPDRQLAQLLEQTDAIRFSGRAADAETVRRLSGLSRELVREIDRLRSSSTTQAA